MSAFPNIFGKKKPLNKIRPPENSENFPFREDREERLDTNTNLLTLPSNQNILLGGKATPRKRKNYNFNSSDDEGSELTPRNYPTPLATPIIVDMDKDALVSRIMNKMEQKQENLSQTTSYKGSFSISPKTKKSTSRGKSR